MTLLIGTANGVWEVATSAGRAWPWGTAGTRLALESGPIGGLTLDRDSAALAISANGYLWRRDGRRWRKLAAPLAKALRGRQPHAAVTALAAGPDGALWAGVAPAALWRLAPGDVWRPCAGLQAHASANEWWGLHDAAAPAVTAIAPHPRDPAQITVAVAVGGVFHSADGGHSWQARNAGITPLLAPLARALDAHRDVVALARHPQHPEIAYCLTESALYRAELTAGAWRWSDVTPRDLRGEPALHGDIMPLPAGPGAALAILPDADDRRQGTLWETETAGARWRRWPGAPCFPLPAPGPAGGALAGLPRAQLSPADPALLAVVAPAGEVYLRETERWRLLASGLGAVTGALWAD